MSGYIPPGYATVRDAVTKLADAWHPKLTTLSLAEKHSLADPVIASLAASFAARREMVEGPRRALQERLEAYRRVRQALAEGLLPSIVIAQDTGQRWRVPPNFWASKQADNDVTASGTVSLLINGVPILGTPLVEDRDVRAIAVGETPPSLAESVARSTSPAKATYQPSPQAMPLPRKKDRAVQRNRVKGEMKAAIQRGLDVPGMSEVAWEAMFDASRDTCRKAMAELLSEMSTNTDRQDQNVDRPRPTIDK